MKAKFSPLELNKFELIQSQFKFNLPKKDDVNVQRLFKSYAVDIEFEHIFQENNRIQVFVKIEVNQLNNPKDGYSLMSEGMGVFSVNNQGKLSDDLLNNLKFYSSLNMMINNLRNIMYQTSNLGPMGGYLLPPVDIMDLFQKKSKRESKS